MEIDIISLDNKIQSQLKNEEEKLEKYKETIMDIEKLLEKNNLEMCTKTKLEKSKQYYKEKIYHI